MTRPPDPAQVALALAALQVLAPGDPPTLPAQVWFGELAGTFPLTEDQHRLLTAWLADRLLHQRDPAPPAALREDTLPRGVFLTMADLQGTHDVRFGLGRGILAATEAALDDLPPSWRMRAPRILKVDVLNQVQPIGRINLTEPLPLDRSLHGLAMDAPGLAWLPEESLAHRLIDREGYLQAKAARRYLERRRKVDPSPVRALQSGPGRGWRFTTLSAWADNTGTGTLSRGRPRIEEVDRALLVRAAQSAGRYLSSVVGEDGRFVYTWLPKRNRASDSYNILRHAGTTWSMLDLHADTGDPELLAAIGRAVRFLVAQTHPTEVKGQPVRCLVEKDEVKLGGHGLALVALSAWVQATGERELLPVMRDLARWILLTQDEDGRFSVHKQDWSTGKLDAFVSDYYPGEALLGLMRLNAVDPDPALVEGAAKGARWLITVRDGGKSDRELDHDHWLLYALNDLHRAVPDPIHLQHARRIVRAILDTQHRNVPSPGWDGGWYRPPRTTPTATRAEGLAAAYALLKDHGEPAELPPLREAIALSMRFQLAHQYEPASAMYLPDPQRVLGGFRNGFDADEIRIDYVQHSLSAILAWRRLAFDADQSVEAPKAASQSMGAC